MDCILISLDYSQHNSLIFNALFHQPQSQMISFLFLLFFLLPCILTVWESFHYSRLAFLQCCSVLRLGLSFSLLHSDSYMFICTFSASHSPKSYYFTTLSIFFHLLNLLFLSEHYLSLDLRASCDFKCSIPCCQSFLELCLPYGLPYDCFHQFYASSFQFL